MTVIDALAKRIQDLLNERGISIYKFAKDNCIPRSTLNNILIKQIRNPGIELLYQIANGFGMNIVEFLNDPLLLSNEIEFLN